MTEGTTQCVWCGGPQFPQGLAEPTRLVMVGGAECALHEECEKEVRTFRHGRNA